MLGPVFVRTDTSRGIETFFWYDELSNQAQLFAEENFTWTFPSQDLAWTVI